MALNFTTQLATPQGIIIDNAYGRVAVLNGVGGKSISAAVDIFVSEQAFEAAAQPIPVIVDLETRIQFPYDYATDQHDILDLAHDMLIQSLAQQGFTATKNL